MKAKTCKPFCGTKRKKNDSLKKRAISKDGLVWSESAQSAASGMCHCACVCKRVPAGGRH